MTPQELKNSILQLAIQGKLVEQRPEEGTGEELFREIQAEKQKLVKAGKIKKEKPLPEITDDEKPFDIPDSWKWCRIGDLFQHNTGKALNGADKNGTPLTYITTSNLYWNRFELGKLKEMPFAESEIEKCTVQKGDLLVCEGGDFGRAAIWPYDDPIRIQNHIHRLRPYYPVSIQYFYYIFYLYKNAGLIAGKGIGIQGLSSNVLHALKVPLPPLAEQKRIVAKIEELLPLIDRYGQAWERLEEFNKRFPGDMQKAILQLAIQGKLVEQRPEEGTGEELFRKIQAEKQKLVKAGKIRKEKPLPEIAEDEKPFDIPDSWKWVRLGEVSEVQLGKMLDHAKNKGKPFPYLANQSVRWRSFDLSALKTMPFTEDECEKFALLPGDVLMCEGGVPGRCAVWRQEKSPIKYQKAVHRIRSAVLFPDFTQFFFEAICDSTLFATMFTGTTIKHLPRETLANIPIPLPPLAEQKRIVARIEELLPLCEKLK